ncbi:MAG: DUF6265 family protein [Ignavibacteriales bacterium]|nr:MAG: hypothetical protein F9K26_00020 [Ignavibacteriaceae bacterium]MBW7871796.1 hypothetical protein [Ignavibacteria bacterium]MCZ2144354.1 DUF6265 family protein [Ignavibacteriales bacterium]OQY72414.1 MAG: hypothetical protein B6D45_09150 [Ignavibacteriales bacterium UTCHB3]MBV6446307.1 hypothetical protein [Ignavibacteriaceae bacterium]
MRKFSLIVLIVLFFTTLLSVDHLASGFTYRPYLAKLYWLKGKWSRVNAGIEHIETWRVVKDSLLEGESYYTKSNSKPATDKLMIRWERGELFFYKQSAESSKIVRYKNILLTESLAVFENRENDYPNKITYRRIDTRSYQVIYDNNENTNQRKYSFKLVSKR